MELVTVRDIQLYNLKKEHERDRPVPQWAAVKRQCGRLSDYD
jgi:ribosomal protein L39E